MIFRMVVEKPTWGAPRIHGELLMLGFDVSERTVYILIRDNGAYVHATWDIHIFRKSGWDKKQNRPDLSYRYAVAAMFEFPQ